MILDPALLGYQQMMLGIEVDLAISVEVGKE